MRLRTSLGAAVLAGMALVAAFASGGCTTQSCTSLYVPSQATMDRPVTASFDPTDEVHVELCRNDSCIEGDFVPTDDASAKLCRTRNVEPLGDGCVLSRGSDGTWRFGARWDLSNVDAHDGDRYRARLVSGKGVVLVSEDVTASYDESEPNGEGCGTVRTGRL